MDLKRTLKNLKQTKDYPFGLFINPYDDNPIIPINYDIFKYRTFMWIMDGVCNKELLPYPLYIKKNNIIVSDFTFKSQYSFIINNKSYYFHKNNINKLSKHYNLYYKKFNK